jgi:tetratricopeptide (TPR) repeat protein
MEISSKLDIAPHVLPRHEDDDFNIVESIVPEKLRLDTKDSDKRIENQGDDYTKLLQLGKALKVFEHLKNEYADMFPDSPERSYFIFESGHLLYHLGMFEEANNRLKEAKTFVEGLKLTTQGVEEVEMRVEVLINLALVEVENKSLEKFNRYMDEAFNLVKKHQFTLQLKVSQMHLYMGSVNDRLGFNFSHLKQSLRGYQDALQIKRAVLGEQGNPYIYEILNNIGLLNMKMGKFDDALRNFEELNEIENRKSLDPNTGERRAEILSNMAMTYKEKGRIKLFI